MLNENIIIDKGVLGLLDGEVDNNFNLFSTHLVKYFGATLAHNFNTYKNLSFSFQAIGGSKTVVNGFPSKDEFVTFINNKYSDGSYYTSEVELTIYMDIDVKMISPTLYAKNSKMGQFKGRDEYRTGRIVEEGYDFWNDSNLIEFLRKMWSDMFSEDLTTTFLTNHPEMKGMFWTKKDADDLGVCSTLIEVGNGGNSKVKLYCVDDSDPSTDNLVMSDMNVAQLHNARAYVGQVKQPKYYIFNGIKTLDIIHNALSWSIGVPIRDLVGYNYSIINVHSIQITADLGSGVKTYRALKIDPVGVDTIYFDYIDNTKYRVYSVTRAMNGNMKMKEIPFSTGGFQRLGRVGTSQWLNLDKNDSTSQSLSKGLNDTHFVYQDKISGKFSRLSKSKMRQVKDARFKVPFFSLVS